MPRACPKCVEKSKMKEEEHNRQIIANIETQFLKFSQTNSKSLLKKHLTVDVLNRLKTKKTSYGSTLLDCIISGFENFDSTVGVYASDVDAYTVFAELFDPIIADYHVGFNPTNHQPDISFGDPKYFRDLDPTEEFIISTRIRVARSIDGFPFKPCMTETHYREVEEVVSGAVLGFSDDLEGKYSSLVNISEEKQHQLTKDHYLFGDCDRFLHSINACGYWPIGRGVFYNKMKTFILWCNEKDHVKIISMEPGSNLVGIYTRLIKGIFELESRISFVRHPRLGYVTVCPTNLGTAIRASVLIMLPNLEKSMDVLEKIVDRFQLRIRRLEEEFTNKENDIFIISNKRTLGLTEFEAVKQMYDGVREIIRQERSLKQ